MKRRSSLAFDFRPSTAERRRQQRQQRALDRAVARRRRADEKARRKLDARRLKEQRRLEARWRKEARRRRIADDKRIRTERRRWLRQQKREGLGGGGGRQSSAAGLRTARNLLTLANQIGVRFTKADQDALIAFADQELAGSGDDVYTLYQRLTSLTFIGRRVLAVIGEYSPEDVESGNADPQDTMIVAKVQAAAEMLGAWQRTNSVQDANALGVVITNVLGATPDAIKEDQRQYERELGQEQYQAVLEKYAGKSQLWMAMHYWLHPEDRPANAQAIALSELDQEIRSNDTADARAQEALAGTGESATVVNDNPLSAFISNVRNSLGI